ncbi:MAG: amidohydrolase [Pseudomonadales bacterium]|nr:amidohydrolase [Pseudomonadales bacterium]
MSSNYQHRALDSLINSTFLSEDQGAGLSHLFKDLKDRPQIDSAESLLEVLDQANIGACVISIMVDEHAAWVGRAHADFPKKILPAMIVNPLNGMDEIRKVVHYHEEYGVRCLRIPPFRYTLPPTDRVYWPFYAKAIELDMAVSMNAGMPGPRRPGWVQNPVYYDEVAFHFPELRLIMTHCGQPWVEEAISTLAHWDNVYMCCCAVAPKYWQDNFVQFINTRGKEKMMFGTEYPTIDWQRGRDEIEALQLRDSVQSLFFFENAKRAYAWDADLD